MTNTNIEKVRIDKWLWAARFFKTRSLATQAVSGGKIHCNSKRIKPAREVKIGDQLTIQKGAYHFVVIVIGISDKRRSAKEAVMLYEETEESMEARETVRADKKLFKIGAEPLGPLKRPSKRDRRLIRSFTRKD